MAKQGPTQGAERHSAKLDRWQSRPWLARVIKAVVVFAPLVGSIVFTWQMGKHYPPERLGMNKWLWVLLVFVAANVLLFVFSKLTRRLMPLVALLKLTLVFPDNAPSRSKAALRGSNSRTMLRDMEAAKARGDTTGAALYGDYIVQLLSEVNEHDRLTRGHSERVRAYSELLGEEIGLSEKDMNLLRWAALLHDVGKLTVPTEILNKDGKPTDDEWKLLQGHPAASRSLLEPLRPWLGEWVHAADQHHCRWDGNGYPDDLAGTDISVAGRLVAIADAFDVMTSARSYKKPLSPELARQELTACAGSQFDPMMVRAFLQIGLGRLKAVSGPLAWLANLSGSAQLPAPTVSVVATTTWSAAVAVVGVVAVAVSSQPAEPEIAQELPMAAPSAIEVQDVDTNAVQNEPLTVTLTASGVEFAPSFVVAEPVEGFVSEPAIAVRTDADTWSTTVTYESKGNYIGLDGFTFKACDIDLTCAIGRVLVDIEPASTLPVPTTTTPTTTTPTTTAPTTTTPTTAPPTTASPTTTAPTTTTPPAPNRAPVAVDDSATILEDSRILVDVAANDTDADADTLTIVGISTPLHGTAEIRTGGIYYKPADDFFGTDAVVYTISDGVNPAASGVLRMTMTPLNDRPTASASAVSIDENTAVGEVVLQVVANDIDGDALTFTLSGGDPASQFSVSPTGELTVAAPLDYEDDQGYDLEVTVSDGGLSDVAVLTIDINDIDEDPVALNDSSSTDEEVSVDIDVATNSSDPENQPLTWIPDATSVEGGTVTSVGPVFTYTPADDFEGTDSFEFVVRDPGGNTSIPATVAITVNPVNDIPKAEDDSGAGYTGLEDNDLITPDVTTNDSDIEDTTILNPGTAEVFTNATNGTAVSNNDGTFTYTPDPNYNGPDSFTYKVTDSEGAESDPATINITIDPDNDAPQANDDSGAGYTGLEDNDLITPDVTTNDSDIEDTTILNPGTAEVFTNATNGTAVSNNDGTFTYTPDPNYNGPDSFTYKVTDSEGAESDPATINITIDPDNDAPQANDDSGAGYTGLEDNDLITPDVTTNDSDIEDTTILNPGTAEVFTNATNGTAVSNNDGTFTYTPDPNYNGPDSFTYKVTDSEGAESDPATINITIDPDNDAPQANDDTLTVDRGEAATTIDVRLNDGDIDNDPLIVTSVSAALHGTAVHNGDGTITYTHDGSKTLTDTFTYVVSDVPSGESDSATVVVTVNPGEDGDGVSPATDNCPFHFNPLQIDTDGDGIGDVCDPSPTVGLSFSLTDGGDLNDNNDRSFAVALGDVDGDGDLDAVFGNVATGNTVELNDGSANFTDSGQSLGSDTADAVALGDIDGDGDLDAVFGNKGAPDTVWVNDGNGSFTDSGQGLGVNDTASLVFGDFDFDGDLDIATAVLDGNNKIWINDANGNFADSGQNLGAQKGTAVAVGDLDDDGDLDLIFGHEDQDNTVWVNDGNGVFTNTGQILGDKKTHDVALADLDDDGDLDVVFAEDTDGGTVWLNDGAGNFSDTGQNHGNDHSHSVSLGDIGGDGDIDIIFGDHTGANTVYINDGSGNFSDTGQSLGDRDTEAIALGDMNGDGRLDAVAANDSDPNRVWLN